MDDGVEVVMGKCGRKKDDQKGQEVEMVGWKDGSTLYQEQRQSSKMGHTSGHRLAVAAL